MSEGLAQGPYTVTVSGEEDRTRTLASSEGSHQLSPYPFAAPRSFFTSIP